MITASPGCRVEAGDLGMDAGKRLATGMFGQAVLLGGPFLAHEDAKIGLDLGLDRLGVVLGKARGVAVEVADVAGLRGDGLVGVAEGLQVATAMKATRTA